MAELKEYIAKKDNGGSIAISEEVLASIAGVAAMEIDGVASLGTASVTDLLGIKSPSKGVKVTISEDAIEIAVTIGIKKDFVIPTVATAVQDAVLNAVEDMAGVRARAVNVKVNTVSFENASKKQGE